MAGIGTGNDNDILLELRDMLYNNNEYEGKPIEISASDAQHIRGFEGILEKFFPRLDGNSKPTSNAISESTRTLENKLNELNKTDKQSANVLEDILNLNKNSSQVNYRIATIISDQLSKLWKSEVEHAKQLFGMVESMSKANVLIGNGQQDFITSATELANKVGISTDNLVSSIASNSTLVNRLSAMNRDGVAEYTNALSGWKDVVGMTAKEAPMVMQSVNGLTATMTRAEFEIVDMKKIFKDVAINGKTLSNALGVSTEELVKINTRQEKNLALEGFKMGGMDNQLKLNSWRAKGFSDDAITYFISGAMNENVATQMSMNPKLRELYTSMRQSQIDNDDVTTMWRKNRNIFNESVDYNKEYAKNFGNSVVGAYSDTNSPLYLAMGTLQGYVGDVDELLTEQKKKDNGEKLSDQYEIYESLKKVSISFTQAVNDWNKMLTPTTEALEGAADAMRGLMGAISFALDGNGTFLRTIFSFLSIANPVISSILIVKDVLRMFNFDSKTNSIFGTIMNKTSSIFGSIANSTRSMLSFIADKTVSIFNQLTNNIPSISKVLGKLLLSVGGLVLTIDTVISAGTAKKMTGWGVAGNILKGLLGGALTGFQFGGPIGALLGGILGGAAVGLPMLYRWWNGDLTIGEEKPENALMSNEFNNPKLNQDSNDVFANSPYNNENTTNGYISNLMQEELATTTRIEETIKSNIQWIGQNTQKISELLGKNDINTYFKPIGYEKIENVISDEKLNQILDKNPNGITFSTNDVLQNTNKDVLNAVIKMNNPFNSDSRLYDLYNSEDADDDFFSTMIELEDRQRIHKDSLYTNALISKYLDNDTKHNFGNLDELYSYNVNGQTLGDIINNKQITDESFSQDMWNSYTQEDRKDILMKEFDMENQYKKDIIDMCRRINESISSRKELTNTETKEEESNKKNIAQENMINDTHEEEAKKVYIFLSDINSNLNKMTSAFEDLTNYLKRKQA